MHTKRYTDSENIKVNKKWNSLQVLKVWVECNIQPQSIGVCLCEEGLSSGAGLRSTCCDSPLAVGVVELDYLVWWFEEEWSP